MILLHGGVTERPNVPVLKTGDLARGPRVQISPPPPTSLDKRETFSVTWRLSRYSAITSLLDLAQYNSLRLSSTSIPTSSLDRLAKPPKDIWLSGKLCHHLLLIRNVPVTSVGYPAMYMEYCLIVPTIEFNH